MPRRQPKCDECQQVFPPEELRVGDRVLCLNCIASITTETIRLVNARQRGISSRRVCDVIQSADLRQMADVMIQLSGGIEGFAKQYMVDLALARALRPGSKTVLDGMRVIGDMVRRSTEMQIAIEEKQKDRDLAVITQSDLESELKDLLKRMESKKVETPLIEQDLPDEMLDVDMPPDA